MDPQSSKICAENSQSQYKAYPRRWMVLFIVVLLNISNAATWISFFPVAKTTSNFFGKPSSAINWFSFVFFIVPMLCFGITTYFSNRLGLKFLIQVGSAFNFVGAMVKAFGVSPLVDDQNNQYIVCLVGQAIASVAQTFALYIPTKVSSMWFPKDERNTATVILSLAYSVGTTVTQFATPLFVKDKYDIPTLVYVCCALAMIVQVLTLIFITSSHPKTPPSESAEKTFASNLSYSKQLKEVFATPPFVLLLITMSFNIGIVAGLSTLTEQIICNVGYSDEFAGALIGIMYCGGFLSAFLANSFLENYKVWETVVKCGIAAASISFILISEFLLYPDINVLLGMSYALYGMTATGLFPTTLELCVELTYPADEALPTGLVYFVGQICAIFMIFVVPTLAKEIPFNEHNVCNENSFNYDYSISVTLLMVVFCVISINFIMFFKPIFKRREYEASKKKQEDSHGVVNGTQPNKLKS